MTDDDVDERQIRAHLARERQERERRRRAGRDRVRAAPFVAGAAVLGIAAVVIGLAGGQSSVVLPGVVMLLVSALLNRGGGKRQSSVAVVRQASMQVVAVACPKCGAKVNERCKLPALDVRICHEERGRRYAQAEAQVYRDTKETQP